MGTFFCPFTAPRYVATPLAGLLNVKEKIRLKAAPNATLEKFYVTTKHPKQVRGTGRSPEARDSPGSPRRDGDVPAAPRPTWRRCPSRAAAPCGRSSAGSAAAATRTGPACSRSSARRGEPRGRRAGDTRGGRTGAAGRPRPSLAPCAPEDRLLPFSSWRFTFYLIAFIAGMAVIVDVSIVPALCPQPPGPL